MTSIGCLLPISFSIFFAWIWFFFLAPYLLVHFFLFALDALGVTPFTFPSSEMPTTPKDSTTTSISKMFSPAGDPFSSRATSSLMPLNLSLCCSISPSFSLFLISHLFYHEEILNRLLLHELELNSFFCSFGILGNKKALNQTPYDRS